MRLFTTRSRPMLLGIIVVAATFCLSFACCCAQLQKMPAVHGKTLNGDHLSLPLKAGGRPTVLVFGFARSAKEQGKAWGMELLAWQEKDNGFDFYQVAVLDGAPRFTHGLITRAIRAEVPRAYHSHTLLLTGGDKRWKQVLDVTDESKAYIVLCSPSGTIQWKSRGSGKEQFLALKEQLDAVNPVLR